jgi:chromatin assembly factor 1 subunit A
MEKSAMEDVKVIKPVNPEFSKWILPFFPPEHTEIAPYNRFLLDRSCTDRAPEWFETPVQQLDDPAVVLRRLFGSAKPRTKHIRPVKNIVSELGRSADRPIDLTTTSPLTTAERSLKQIPYKILSFREDVRPPYQGTFTRPVSPRTSRKLSRMPTTRGLPQVDYDYDSEAEWEAPEAGDEDLDDDDERSVDEDPEDNMGDFLDDEDEIARRRVIAADVEPVCTGLCWEGEADHTVAGINLALYRMDVLSDDTRLPIDPYSTAHWANSNKTTPLKPKPLAGETAATSMQPPRLPLMTVTNTYNSPTKTAFDNFTGGLRAASGQENAVMGVNTKPANPKKPIKSFPQELLPEFKAAVAGSDLNKVAIIEILKKQFGQCSKDTIKATLETVAVRQGVKEADKRWVLVA